MTWSIIATGVINMARSLFDLPPRGATKNDTLLVMPFLWTKSVHCPTAGVHDKPLQ